MIARLIAWWRRGRHDRAYMRDVNADFRRIEQQRRRRFPDA